MNINFDTILLTLDGDPIESGNLNCPTCGNVKNAEDLSLEKVSVVALFNTSESIKGPEKLDRFILAQRVKQFPVVDLSAEDITIIRKCIADTYGPLIYGRASEILDPAAVKKIPEVPKVTEK